MNQKNLQPNNFSNDISGCRAQLLGNNCLAECLEEAACQWSVSLGYLKFCEHPSVRMIAQSA